MKHADFIILDLLSLAVAFVLAYWLKFEDFGFLDSSMWKSLFVMLLLTNFVLMLVINPYSGIFRRGYWADVGSNLKLAIGSFVIACVVFYLFKIGEAYSREMLITTYVIYLVLSLLVKAVHKRRLLTRREKLPSGSVRRVILATTSHDAKAAEKLVSAEDVRFADVVGFCLVDASESGELHDKPTAPPDGIVRLVMQLRADEVLVTVDPALIGAETFELLVEDGVRVSFAIEEAFGIDAESQTLGRRGVFKTLDMERYLFGTGQMLYLPIKRLFDIVLGLIGCLFTLLVAIVVKLGYLVSGDRHSIIYRQTRIGVRGEPFEMYKFRTMVWNADEELARLLKDPELRVEWVENQKLENDPRITRVGRVLRRTSLDEFPQFLNVLRGQMSVVGPRPLVPGELEEHGGRMLYNRVKPGITGWWGCNGRSNIDYRERLELEYHYVRHCSLYLDVLCIFRTAVAVIKRDGAQ